MVDDETTQDMSDQPQTPQRRSIRVVLALVILAGLGVCAVAVADQVRLRTQLAACRNPDPAVRLKALDHFARQRDGRARRVLAEFLEREADRPVLERAGYAAMRIGDTGLLDPLQRRAAAGPDDAVRAKLVLYTARLSKRDARLVPWLAEGIKAEQEPWRQVASAAGLLYLGEPRGGPALIALARRPGSPAHALALAELGGLVGAMTETVGWPIAWPAPGVEPEPAFWASLDAFWKEHGTTRLLDDVLTRRTSRNPRVYELGRLIHARDKIAKWFE